MEEQSEETKRGRIDVEKEIINNLSKIKGCCDSITSILNKEGKSDEDDISQANELADEMDSALQETLSLMFELEDTLEDNLEETKE